MPENQTNNGMTDAQYNQYQQMVDSYNHPDLTPDRATSDTTTQMTSSNNVLQADEFNNAELSAIADSLNELANSINNSASVNTTASLSAAATNNAPTYNFASSQSTPAPAPTSATTVSSNITGGGIAGLTGATTTAGPFTPAPTISRMTSSVPAATSVPNNSTNNVSAVNNTTSAAIRQSSSTFTPQPANPQSLTSRAEPTAVSSANSNVSSANHPLISHHNGSSTIGHTKSGISVKTKRPMLSRKSPTSMPTISTPKQMAPSSALNTTPRTSASVSSSSDAPSEGLGDLQSMAESILGVSTTPPPASGNSGPKVPPQPKTQPASTQPPASIKALKLSTPAASVQPESPTSNTNSTKPAVQTSPLTKKSPSASLKTTNSKSASDSQKSDQKYTKTISMHSVFQPSHKVEKTNHAVAMQVLSATKTDNGAAQQKALEKHLAEKKEKEKRARLIILGAIVFVAAIGGAVFFALNK